MTRYNSFESVIYFSKVWYDSRVINFWISALFCETLSNEFLLKNSHGHVQRGDVYEFKGFNVAIFSIHVVEARAESTSWSNDTEHTQKNRHGRASFSSSSTVCFFFCCKMSRKVPSVSKTTGLITLAERNRGAFCAVWTRARGKTVTFGISLASLKKKKK